MIYKKFGLLLLSVMLSWSSYAQEENEEHSENEKIHTIAFVFGYTHIPAAFEEGHKSKSVFVPTIGLDYFMKLDEKWKIGAALDLELSNYLVDFKKEELERERALVTALLVGYEFSDNWSALLGTGIEFEKNKNLFILRASVEYEFELGNYCGLFPSINYDLKEEYDTWSLNIGFSKSF